MRRSIALAVVLAAVAGAPAAAAPVDVHVRVEGRTSTLFDRVVRSDGHDVRAASDTAARRCDGTNNGANPAPGATATGATVDAMASIGQDFDARWYPGFDDYFLTRWGPDAESNAAQWWWGILVNRVFTPVGGCQFQVNVGDEVLWVYDAFNGRPFLWLDGPDETTLGVATSVTVTATDSSTENDDTTGSPYAGAQVAGVGVDAQPAPPGTVTAATSNVAGEAVVTFQRPGWQRLKARDQQPGQHPVAIASNSIDICVRGTDGSGCDGPPPSQIPVTPEDPGPGPTDPTATPTPTPIPAPTGAASPSPPFAVAPVRLSAPEVVARDRRRGRVTVRWDVLDPGPGVGGWVISAREAGRTEWTVRARGTRATSTRVRLPAGRLWALRLEVTDTLGRAATAALETVLVPVDDRANGVRYRGRWTRARDSSAWRGTVSSGRRGARAAVRLPAGRPLLALRAGPDAARIEVLAGRRREVFRIAAGGAAERRVTAARRPRAGTVRVRVLDGTVRLDGVAVAR